MCFPLSIQPVFSFPIFPHSKFNFPLGDREKKTKKKNEQLHIKKANLDSDSHSTFPLFEIHCASVYDWVSFCTSWQN